MFDIIDRNKLIEVAMLFYFGIVHNGKTLMRRITLLTDPRSAVSGRAGLRREQPLLRQVQLPLLGRLLREAGASKGWAYTKRPRDCFIKLITAVIYGFCNQLECLSLNTRLG